MQQLEPLELHEPGEAVAPSDTGLLCPRCDYNLTGLTLDRCPECGLQGAVRLARRNGAKRRRTRALIIMFGPFVAFVLVAFAEMTSVEMLGGIRGGKRPTHVRVFMCIELLLLLFAFVNGILLSRQLRHFESYRRASTWVKGVMAFVASVAYLGLVFLLFWLVGMSHMV